VCLHPTRREDLCYDPPISKITNETCCSSLSTAVFLVRRSRVIVFSSAKTGTDAPRFDMEIREKSIHLYTLNRK
jgi:hypothetical protein